MGGPELLPPACFSPRKSWLMPACLGRLPSPTALNLNRQQLGIHQGVWREAPVSGPLHVPLGWQALHGVPKLSSKEMAFFWGCSAPNSQCSKPNTCTQQWPLDCSCQEQSLSAPSRASETSPGCSPCLEWRTPYPELGLGLGPAKVLSQSGQVYTTADPVKTELSL